MTNIACCKRMKCATLAFVVTPAAPFLVNTWNHASKMQRTFCMKTQSPRNNKAAKNRRVSNPTSGTGKGFGESTTKSENSNNSQAEGRKAPNRGTPVLKDETTKNSTSDADVLDPENQNAEEPMGGTGDATPHRVNLPDAKPPSLEDPAEDDELDLPEPEPLVELPVLTREELVSLRFDLDTSLDQLIEYFADARSRSDFSAVVTANRHLVSNDLLYYFTSAILQVEGRAQNSETKGEEAQNMRALRKDLVAHCWSFDFDLKRAVLLAEQRVLGLLTNDNVDKNVSRVCGRTQVDVIAFWLVIYAAVVAWEDRGKENQALVNIDTQTVLTQAAEQCRTSKEVREFLSPCLQAVQEILSSINSERQVELVQALTDDDIVELMGLTEAFRLLPSGAYGGLTDRMTEIVEYALNTKYNIQPRIVEPVRFNCSEIERGSGLVEFSKRASRARQV